MTEPTTERSGPSEPPTEGDRAPREESGLLAAVRSLHASTGLEDLHARLGALLKVHLGCASWSVLARAEGEGTFTLRAGTRQELDLGRPFPVAPGDGPLDAALRGGPGVVGNPGFPAVVEWQGKGVPLAACHPLAWEGVAFGALAIHEFLPEGPRKPPAQLQRWLATFADHLAVAETQVRALEEARAGARFCERKLAVVAEVGKLMKVLDPAPLNPKLLETLMASCGANGGALLLDRDDKLCREVERGILDRRVAAILLATRHPLVNECAETGRCFLFADVRAHPRLDPTTVPSDIESLLVLPLQANGKPLGVLALASNAERGPFTEADLQLLQSVGEMAAAVLETVNTHRVSLETEYRKQEFAVAGRVQRGVLPARSPDIAGCLLDGMSISCDGGGGDYYDWVRLGERKVGIAIGDVSGHGIPVAILLMGVRAFLRARAEMVDDPGELLTQLNGYVKPDLKQGMIMSLFYGVLDLEAGTLRFASAGHDAPALFRSAEGRFDEPDRTGPALGMLSGARFTSDRLDGLASGDYLMLLTDGIWEQHNPKGEQFGRRRVLDAIREYRHLPPNEFIKVLRGLHRGFRGDMPQEDDMTLVVGSVRSVG
ncbi:MAG: SpoIIE family protein phosphatase [Planctomycetes bacterium]|nr:SpoIIE family protein phosphatase [Planctomycetota bacterium]